MSESQKPIGYWLKRADEVLTERIDDAQRVNGLTRIDWQILNVIQEAGSATGEEIAEKLQPFADARAIHDAITRLGGRGLLAGSYSLSTLGQRTHATALVLQKEVRQQAMRGISEGDYESTIAVLQQIVENLTVEEIAQA